MKAKQELLKKNNLYFDQQLEESIIESSIKSIQKVSIKINNPTNLQKFINKIEEQVPETFPIDIFLDVDRQDLRKIFSNAKYAIKYDEKGWANNASGLVNLLAYGCILYTGWGICTDKEEIEKYKGAIVVPTRKYCLKEGEHLTSEEAVIGKKEYFVVDKKKAKTEKKVLICPEDIIRDIISRENNQKNESEVFITTSNEETFEQANLLFKLFDPTNVAGELIEYFNDI